MSRDRDRILEQALKHELRGNAPTAECLDAEMLAAWLDGTLDAAQMSAAELHTSTCARCQAMLAAFARGTPSTLGTLGTPGTLGTSGTLGTPGTPSWWKWWLAPLAAGAAAVTLWMVVPEEQKLATAPPQPQASVAIDATQSRAAEQAPPPLAPPAAEEIERKRDAANSKLNAEAAREDRQQFKDAPAPKEETAVAQMAPPPATVAVGAAAAPAARNEGFAAAPSADLQKSARLSVASIEVATLDRNHRWRITGNRIELTANAGTTWTLVRDQPNEGISAGSAPTPSVAWFVGRAGLVLVTKDGGASFDEVSIAEPLDIASVSAVDARTASIFTTSGRRFRTDDGGRTWRPF